MSAKTKMTREIKLPRWEAAHKRLSTEYVGSSFLSEIPEKVTDGYAVVRPGDNEPPYLVVANRGSIYEMGRVEKSHGNQNIGSAYTGVEPGEVRGALEGDDGEVSVYELPEEVAENICKVINSETRYGDLKTEIVDVNEIFETLEEDSFSGNIVFTNPSNYSFVELRDGEVTNCWHRGDAGCSTTADLRATQFEEGLEVNIFEKEDISESGRSIVEGNEIKESSRNTEDDGGKKDADEETGVDCAGVIEAVTASAAEVIGRDRFYEGLSRAFSDADGVFVEGGEVVVENPDAETVFEGIYEALEESTGIVPPSNVIDKAHDEVESIEGGDEFLQRYG